jgi:hypothetical protein
MREEQRDGAAIAASRRKELREARQTPQQIRRRLGVVPHEIAGDLRQVSVAMVSRSARWGTAPAAREGP